VRIFGKTSNGNCGLLTTSNIFSLLRDKNIKTFRSDQAGDIEIISDGESFLMRN